MAQQKDRTKAVEMHFLTAMYGYQLTEHRCTEDIREELQIADIYSRIKD
jgi:hypothetical protein